MRVAIDCRTATARMSGVGRYVINLVESLSTTADLQLLLLVGTSVHDRLRHLRSSTLVDLGATSTTQEERLKWEQVDLPRLLRRLGVDLYHATWNYGVPGLSRLRTVLTVHDLFPLYTPAEFGSRRSRLAFFVSQHVALLRSARIIAVSTTTKAEIGRYAPWAARRVRVVPEAADPMFTPGAHDSTRRYLLYVGGFEPRKNIPVLLRAFEIAVTRLGVSLPMYLLGSPSKFDAQTQEVWKGLPSAVQQMVEFHTCDDPELPRMYRGAVALVFPSTFEGFGLPPLEAMACGTPVITTRCGAIPETVGSNACFVDADNPEQFADAIARVLRDGQYAQTLIEHGLKQATRTNWHQIAERTLEVYREAAGRS